MSVRTNVDYSTRDYEGFRTDLINLLKEKVPEYTDFSQSDVGVVLIELLSHGLDICSYYNDVVANEMFLPTARQRESVIKLTSRYGYSMLNATPAKFMQVFEITPQVSDFVIKAGYVVKTKELNTVGEVIFETDQDLVIPAGKTGLEKDGSNNYLYQVPITQGVSVINEVLGSSDGTANQKFMVNNKNVIDSTTLVIINEGIETSRWSKVDNFIDSSPDSKHYVLSFDEEDNCYVEFGNNISGKIPAIRPNGITISYKTGGGSHGNVSSSTIVEVNNPLPEVIRTFNPSTYYQMGCDKESIESAKINAVGSLRTLNRAVTLEDYKSLALLENYVLRANSVKNGTGVDIYVLPIYLSALTTQDMAKLQEVFAQKSLLGVTSTVKSYLTQTVNINLDVKALTYNYNAEVKADVEALVREYFSLGNRDFGGEIVLGDLISTVMSIQGVRSVYSVSPTTDVAVDPTKVPVLGTLTVTVSGGK